MKFNCGLTWEEECRIHNEKWKKKQEWHKTFLWFPKTIGQKDGKKLCYWLCFVERQPIGGWPFDYTNIAHMKWKLYYWRFRAVKG